MAGPPEIIICPASGAAPQANVQKTINTSVPWSSLVPILSPTSLSQLEPVVDGGGLRFWGFRENSRIKKNVPIKPAQSWDKTLVGALLVFTNRLQVTHTCVIGARFYDPVLSTFLWGEDEWPWIVALSEVEPVSGTSSEDFRKAAGVKRVMGAMPVRHSRHAAVLSLLKAGGVTPTSLNQAVAAAEAVAPFDPDEPLSVKAESERRKEQTWLRNILIPGDDGECNLCGSLLPAAFLRAAHVKRRSKCSALEKLDPTNCLVACVRCDIAFERGWIALTNSQQVIRSGSLPAPPDLEHHLSHLAGRIVKRPLRKSSITYHRKHSFIP